MLYGCINCRRRLKLFIFCRAGGRNEQFGPVIREQEIFMIQEIWKRATSFIGSLWPTSAEEGSAIRASFLVYFNSFKRHSLLKGMYSLKPHYSRCLLSVKLVYSVMNSLSLSLYDRLFYSHFQGFLLDTFCLAKNSQGKCWKHSRNLLNFSATGILMPTKLIKELECQGFLIGMKLDGSGYWVSYSNHFCFCATW
jgi:hypothetical protein